MKPKRCKVRYPNQWYHLRDFPGTTHHPCPFPARADGYCKRHSPTRRRPMLLRRRDRLIELLTSVAKELRSMGIPDRVDSEGSDL